jgi:hypothetical protein
MGTLTVFMCLASLFIFYLYRPQIRKAANAGTGVIFGSHRFEQQPALTSTSGRTEDLAYRNY